jgi:hypothetical protein
VARLNGVMVARAEVIHGGRSYGRRTYVRTREAWGRVRNKANSKQPCDQNLAHESKTPDILWNNVL